MPDLALPAELAAHTGRVLSAARPEHGENSDVAVLTAERGRFILKTGSTEKRLRDLQAEFRVLKALADQQPYVPGPVAAAGDQFLFTCLTGVPLNDAAHQVPPADCHRLMAGYAAALHRIHGWRPDLPGSDQPDRVFAHGDYCLPNALVTDGQITSIIDWPTGGYADYRIDLAAGVWSIRYNLRDEAYVETFLHAYGYHEPADSLRPFEAIWQAS